MGFEWERVGPYLKWGIAGGLIGAAISLFASAISHPQWPENVTWSAGMSSMTWFGFFAGLVAGILCITVMQLMDRSSGNVQDHVRAEHKDPTVVLKMYSNIQAGDESEAWHAVALLANYMDPVITRNMLQTLQHRLDDERVETLERLALVRHAVKCITATNSLSNIEQLRPYASDMVSDIGVQVRRMGMLRRKSDYTLK